MIPSRNMQWHISPRHHRIPKQREVSCFLDADVEDLAGVALRVAVEDDDAVAAGAASEAGFVGLAGA